VFLSLRQENCWEAVNNSILTYSLGRCTVWPSIASIIFQYLCPCTETRLNASGNSTNFPEVIPRTPVSKGRELGRQKESRIRRNEMGRKDEGRGGGDRRGGRMVSEDWWPLN
jgi:hypothetical protein